MMERKEKASMWSRLKYSFSDNGGRGNTMSRVEREEDGVIIEYTEQEDVERVVREMTQHRFTMADSSPFCNGLLGEELGYTADTDTARAILEGTYQPPTNTPDSIILVLEEIAKIAKEIGEGAVIVWCSRQKNLNAVGSRSMSAQHRPSQRSILVTTNLLHE
jgi:hypothetical protein